MSFELLFKDKTYGIIGLCMKVHSTLGPGFKEVVYKDALEIELIENKIPYKREVTFKIEYGNQILRHGFDADFLIYGTIIVEAKSAVKFHYEHFRETLNYLKASHVKLGLLVNFGEPSLNVKRILC
jgi:GxxExxY protein